MRMLTDYNTSYYEETNFDHFRKELLELAQLNGDCVIDEIAVVDGVPMDCINVHECTDCDLNRGGSCVAELIKWGFQKYVEPIKLSLSEHCFLGAIETGYIIRDNHDQLFWCETPPSKVDGIWEVQSGDMVNLNFLKCMQLPFVKYEGTSWSVEQLYELPYDDK